MVAMNVKTQETSVDSTVQEMQPFVLLPGPKVSDYSNYYLQYCSTHVNPENDFLVDIFLVIP